MCYRSAQSRSHRLHVSIPDTRFRPFSNERYEPKMESPQKQALNHKFRRGIKCPSCNQYRDAYDLHPDTKLSCVNCKQVVCLHCRSYSCLSCAEDDETNHYFQCLNCKKLNREFPPLESKLAEEGRKVCLVHYHRFYCWGCKTKLQEIYTDLGLCAKCDQPLSLCMACQVKKDQPTCTECGDDEDLDLDLCPSCVYTCETCEKIFCLDHFDLEYHLCEVCLKARLK
jgi:hypothetical protein